MQIKAFETALCCLILPLDHNAVAVCGRFVFAEVVVSRVDEAGVFTTDNDIIPLLCRAFVVHLIKACASAERAWKGSRFCF